MVSYVRTFLVLSYAMYEFALVPSSAYFLNFILFLLFDAVNMVLKKKKKWWGPFPFTKYIGWRQTWIWCLVSLPILSLGIWEEAVSSINFFHLLLPVMYTPLILCASLWHPCLMMLHFAVYRNWCFTAWFTSVQSIRFPFLCNFSVRNSRFWNAFWCFIKNHFQS